MNANQDSGVFIASISPLAPLPAEPQGEIIFRIRMKLVAGEQDMEFDIEIPAHSFDEAAQRAYSRIATVMAMFAKLAKEASDALLSKVGKTT